MSKTTTISEQNPKKGQIIAFGFGAMADQMSHQAFQFLTFTFYYAVIGLSVQTLAWGFIIFAIWDSINDPLFGPISDRTQSRFGRRGFWVLVSIIPFGLVNILLFTVPMGAKTLQAAYMIIIIMAFDLFYTIFSTTQTALFPELFPTEKTRAHANLIKNVMTIVGIIIGFVVPTILISPMVPTESVPASEVNRMYINAGILVGVLTIVFGGIFFKFGVKERPSSETHPEKMPPLGKQLKAALKNKTFVIFVIANLFTWFAFKMLTTIITLYGVHVLGIREGDLFLSVLLLGALLSAAFCFPLQERIGLKVGMRKGFMISLGVWIVTLIPFTFLDNQPIIALVCMIFMGFGLSGAMYYVDIIIAQIIDEDELHSGFRREGTFYGVNALINRYSTILVMLVITAVLSGYGWDQYLVGASIEEVAALKNGLKLLISGFMIMGIVIVLILMKLFPITQEKWIIIQQKLQEKRATTK